MWQGSGRSDALDAPSPASFPQAREAIHGRMFAGSTVEATFMQPQQFLDAIAPPEAPAAEAPVAEAAAPAPETAAAAPPAAV